MLKVTISFLSRLSVFLIIDPQGIHTVIAFRYPGAEFASFEISMPFIFYKQVGADITY